MTENETTLLTDRLHRMADSMTPTLDVVGQVRGARARHARRRRNRITAAALTTAAAAVIVGTTVATNLISASPAGEVAGPNGTTTQPAVRTTGQEQLAASRAAEAARRAAEQLQAVQDNRAERAAATAQAALAKAELAAAVAQFDHPLALSAPAPDRACPDIAASLSRALGVHLQYWQGERLIAEAPCEWGVGEQLVAPIRARMAMQTTFRVGVTVADIDATVSENAPGTCESTSVPAVAAGAVLRRCPTADQVEWSLEVPDRAGSGLWQFGATVGIDYAPVTGPEALAALDALPATTWAAHR